MEFRNNIFNPIYENEDNTGCFRTADTTSGNNKTTFYWCLKTVLLNTGNSKVYNFVHVTQCPWTGF